MSFTWCVVVPCAHVNTACVRDRAEEQTYCVCLQLKEGLFKYACLWLYHLIRVDCGGELGKRTPAVRKREAIVTSRYPFTRY